jgi:hypothetical protein
MSFTPIIDLVVLSRSHDPLAAEVAQGVAAQRGVRVRLHRLVGGARPSDVNRWETIARKRNTAKRLGYSPWLMFLDDDVVLSPDCAATLLEGLRQRPAYGALAADYMQEARLPDARAHVGMGATLFRRSALARVRFRWADGRCECQCCCDDLRAAGIGIGYLSTARAVHRSPVSCGAGVLPAFCGAAVSPAFCEAGGTPTPQMTTPADAAAGPPRILAAFDRLHCVSFRRQFLGSLRAAGNREWVTAVAYGLYPGEVRVVEGQPGVDVWPLPVNGVMPPVRRLHDFQLVLETLPPLTPVAYWDAGDVLFQDSLAGLWEQVRKCSDKLLAVREPKAHPGNKAIAAWTLTIHDPRARRRAFDLLAQRPFLNSGFAAGTAAAMLVYLREAERLRRGPELAGSSDWGDQTALNLYCHSYPERWREVEDGWNYCLHDRRPREVLVLPQGRIGRRDRRPVHVVHGNARSLAKYQLSPYLL